MIMDNRFLVARRRYDPDATRYINAVQLADGQALEPEVAMAVDQFVKGCKADGIWDALKASCILCGARTISGALVPLVGAAPTAYSFASGDYDRTTGLKGSGATKHLDSNRASDADGQDDFHVSVYETETHDNATIYGLSIGMFSVGCVSQIAYRASDETLLLRAKNSNIDAKSRGTSVVGLTSMSRSLPESFLYRYGETNGTIVANSVTPPAGENYYVFAQNTVGTGASGFSNARLAFYSIGSALDLAALDNRVSTLVASIAAAI